MRWNRSYRLGLALFVFLLSGFLASGQDRMQGRQQDQQQGQQQGQLQNQQQGQQRLVRMWSGEDSVARREIRARMDSIRQHRPTLGLVLAGGGAKGAAITGVLQYLDSLGLKADLVTGTSIGGLTGGMYAMGYDWRHLDTLFRTLDWSVILSDKLPAKFSSIDRRERDSKLLLTLPFEKDIDFRIKSMYSGLNVGLLISRLSIPWHDSLSFAKLPVPFACVATEMRRSKAKVWERGSLPLAMRSTMSIPAMFAPVQTEGMVLVDGGLMDNFPADIARELGADIIIAVDLSSSSKKKSDKKPAVKPDPGTIDKVILQTIYLSDNTMTRQNRALADVIIHPELSGFHLLSFNPEAVRLMSENGYKAASALKDTLIGIKKRLGPMDNDRPEGLAVDEKTLAARIVKLASVKAEGLAKADSALVAQKLEKRLKPGEHSIGEIEDAVRAIFGTGSFGDVKYFLKGGQEPYNLVISCRPGQANSLGIGFRVDNEEYAAALVDLGFGEYKLKGASAGITGKIGLNPYAKLRYKYKTGDGFALGAEAKYKYVDSDRFRTALRRHREVSHQATGELYLSKQSLNYSKLIAGARAEYIDVHHVEKDTYLSLFAGATVDSYDDWYFPTRGLRLEAGYTWTPYALDAGKTSFSRLDLEASAAIPLGSRITFLPTANANLGFGDVPLAYRNMAGGQMPGRYYNQQLPFAGLTTVMLTDKNLAIWKAELRVKIASEHYLSAIFNAGNQASKANKLYGKDSGSFSGAALEYGYNSLAGPIKAGIGWNDITKRCSVYFSIGKSF